MEGKPTYEYRAKLLRVIDGDTILVELDLGFRIYYQQALRLYGINAPEIIGAERDKGLASKQHLTDLLTPNFLIRTFKNPGDKYGRWLAEIFTPLHFINAKMVADGYAINKEY